MRSHPSAQKFQDQAALFKSYTELERLQGTGGIRIPAADAKPEEMDAFYNKLGRPDKADGYKIEQPKMPDGVQWDDGLQKGFLETAHKAGLPNKQAQELLNWYAATTGAQVQGQLAQRQEGLQNLQKEWGDKYSENIKSAAGAFAQLVPESDPMYAWLKETGNDTNPVLLKFFHGLSGMMAEGKTINADHAGESRQVAESQDAREQIAAITGDLKSVYHDASAPGHKEARARVAALYEKAYPGKVSVSA